MSSYESIDVPKFCMVFPLKSKGMTSRWPFMHVFDVSGWESIINTTVTCCNSNCDVPEKRRGVTPLNNVGVNVCMSCRKPIKDDGAAEGSDTDACMNFRAPIKDDGCGRCNVVNDDVCMNFRAPIKDCLLYT